MSISDVYDNEFRKRNKANFAAIVKIALSDGEINEKEQLFLNRLATKLNISKEDYKKILREYDNYQIDAPISYDERLERLYDLTRMVWADKIRKKKEIKLLQRFGVGLGFHAVNVKYIARKALESVRHGDDLEEFMYSIKNMNQ